MLVSLPWVATLAQDLKFEVPRLTSPVVDQAGILSPEGRARIEAVIRRLHESGGSQLAVLTVASLGGLSVEEVGIKVVDAWKLGAKEKDDGVLLLVAPNERRMRIEVGQGKEGDLPDALARRIIMEVIGPRFRAGQYDLGILLGVGAIIQQTDPQFDLNAVGISGSATRVQGKKSNRGFNFFPLIILLFIIIRIIRGIRAGVRTPFHAPSGRWDSGYRGSHWGSGSSGWDGSSGWGGGSGGGYSGGGGGFSGGGSSGSW